MCAYSNVIQGGIDCWPQWAQSTGYNYDIEELKRRVAELEAMMRKAVELDKYLKQPDCENEAKKAQLQEMANKLGIKIDFPA